MDDRPKRLADYFLVVGLGDKAELCSESESADCTDLPYSTCDPITELAIMHKGDKVPKRFEVITNTSSGQSANLNAGNILSVPIFLCYCKQSQSAHEQPLPLQPICAISVYYPDRSQPIAEGHEILEKTIGGAAADLNLLGRISTYLTFKRGLLYGHTPAITDLKIIGKDESPPPGFKKLNMNLNKGMGPSLYICYKIAIVKPPSVSYNASILSRYPTTDYEDFPLPDSSPLFCLPLGVCVEHWGNSGQFPLPTFSTFILTNSYGTKMYGSAVTFYEQINSKHESLPQMRKDLGLRDENYETPLYMSKCICMLSRWPFFSAFKVFLSKLYRISLSPGTTLPIERYILNLMSDVPFPSISRPRVMMEIGSEQIVFTLPIKTPLPISISNHWSLVNSLDAENCITLFSLLLMEQKVILHSSRPSLLTCVGEALTSVLFPFQWQCPYIPMCPLSLSVYTQAPMSFIIGIDSRYFDHYETPDDVCVVDLDCNTISIPDEIKRLIATRPLPLKAVKVLRKGLKAIATKLQCMMVDSDLAVELAPLDYAEIASRNSLDQIDINVREVFLRFNGIAFGNYLSCLSPRVADVSESAREAKNLFDQTKFLKMMCAPIDQSFYKAVFNTQMFINFVEQRSYSYSMDTTLAFFDECTEKLHRDPNVTLIKPLAECQKQPDVTVVAAPPHGMGLEKDKKYTYYDGFPLLDHNLFITESSEQPMSPNVDNAKNDPSSKIMVRSTAEKNKSKQATEAAHGDAEVWGKTLLAEIYCIWFIHFPGFLKSDWNKMYHLEKAFNVLEDMHKLGAIPNDEVCYRVLMEQCVKLWKPFMAVKVFSEMQKVGVKPNAVTYGIYNRALIDCNCPASVKSRWRAVVIVICTCLYLRKKVSPDALDGINNMRLARRNSYDEAIGDFFTQRQDSLSSSSSKGSGSPKLVHIKRSRSGSISKKVFSQFGRDGSKKRGKKLKEYQEPEEPEETISTEKKRPDKEQDEGYTVKRGHTIQQTKFLKKLTIDSPDSFDRRNTMSVGRGNKATTLKRPPRSRAPSSMSQYSRRLGDTLSSTRSSNRMNQSFSILDRDDLNINMSSCTECNKCQRLVFDEDIMSNWSALDSVYNTKCPYCEQPFVAQLVVQLEHTFPVQYSPLHSPVPNATTKISKIPEEESLPTPPARRKRDKPIKISKKDSKSSGESTPSDSPKKGEQEYLSSADSSPLVNKVTKQKVASSTDNSPVVNEVTKKNVKLPSDKDTKKQQLFLSASRSPIKQKISSKPSGNGPVVVGSFADDMIKQFDYKATTSDYYSSNDLRSSEDTSLMPSMVPVKGRDSTDVGFSEIAKMKSRGHSRTHSAPQMLEEGPPKTVSEKIAVTTVDIVTTPSGDQSNSSKGRELKEAPPIVVHYLGPLVLRKEVESLLIREGLSYLECKDFPLLSPTVFWNLVWYFTRLGLSSYLPRHALIPFQAYIENKQRNLTINLLWDSIINIHQGPPLYKLWKEKVESPMLNPTDVAAAQKTSTRLQSFAAHLQCWDLLPVAGTILRDRSVEAQKKTGLQRGLYHDLALFCSYLRKGSLDLERFDSEYRDMLQQLPKDLQELLRKEDKLPSINSTTCQMFFNTLYVV